MKAVLEKIKPLTSIIKTVFFVSIILLIIMEILHLRRTISVTQLKAALGGVSPLNIILIFLIGAIAVLPTTGYDFVLNRILKTDKSKGYILQTSWCINTFNNLSGFGGLIDIGLRLAFYGQKEEEERDLQQVTTFLPYLISGLSFVSLVSLGLTYFYGVDRSGIPYYDIVLVGASLYFPILYWLTGRKTKNYFANMPVKTRNRLGIVSFFEWSCAATAFIIIGRLMGIDMPISVTLPFFAIGCAVGIISLIPGALGSFDFIVLTGLSAHGLPKETVLAWLLLYRLAYYVIPFFLGIIFFIKHLGGKINQKYNAVPKEMLEKAIHTITINLIRWLGILLALSTVFFENLDYIPWLSSFDPLQRQVIWQCPGLVLGVCFILLARTVQKKVKLAFPLTMLWLVLTLIYVDFGAISWGFSTMILLSMLAMVLVRPQLYKKQFIYSWEARTKDTLVIAVTLILLFTLAGVIFPVRAQELHDIVERHRPISPDSYLLTRRIVLILTLVITVCYWLLMRIVQGRKIKLGTPFQADRYRDLLATYGGQGDSALAFLGDKRLFWYQKDGQDRVAFQFAIRNNKCLVMGEPAGNEADVEEAISYFIDKADRLDYDLIFYSIGQKLTLYLHEFGFEFMKVGENALVDLDNFTLRGNKYKPFRNALNRVEKDGFSFEVVEAPHSPELLAEARAISDTWLHKRPEKGFSLGYFDEAYLQESSLALVRNQEGKMVAFANVMPNYQDNIASIDMMRYDKDLIPNGVMDYLFISLFVHFREAGVGYFDLGMAPLSGVGQAEESFLQERLAYLVYHFGSHFYSFEGLYRYKEKFTPLWDQRYVSYSRSSWVSYVLMTLVLEDRVTRN